MEPVPHTVKPPRPRIERTVRLALAGLILICLTANMAFIAHKSAPRGLDELDVFAEGVYFHTAGAGLLGLWTMQTDEEIGCPPLLPWAGRLCTALLGRGYMQMAFAATLFQALLLLSMYGIGRRLSGPGAGLLAAAIAATSPIIMSYSRIFTTNLPALAMIGCVLWALLYSQRFTRRRSGLLVGALIALANLAERGTPPLALSLPVVFWCMFSILKARKQPEAFRRVIVQVVIAALVATALSGRYLYFYFFRTASHIAALGAQDVFGSQSQFVVDRLPEWLFYPATLFVVQLSFVWALPFVIALPFFLRRFSAEKLLLILQTLWPMAVMTPFASKVYDFDLGAVAGAIPIAAVGLASIPWRSIRAVLGVAAGLLACLAFWAMNPSLLPQPQWPLAVRDWLGHMNNVGLLMPSDTVYQNRIAQDLARRVPPDERWLFIYNVEPSGPLDSLVCETANFSWLQFPHSEQYAILDPNVPQDGTIEVEIRPLSAEQRRLYRATYFRPPCAMVGYDPPLVPERSAPCRPIYSAEVDGREFLWKLCE
ncbi:MAG: glycosyltransferase family 39 protein [Candidatus Alcyoniella australis]|nr:glycosyltransferase family 39 protein [Candidatus Alcyoniella australis]